MRAQRVFRVSFENEGRSDRYRRLTDREMDYVDFAVTAITSRSVWIVGQHRGALEGKPFGNRNYMDDVRWYFEGNGWNPQGQIQFNVDYR